MNHLSEMQIKNMGTISRLHNEDWVSHHRNGEIKRVGSLRGKIWFVVINAVTFGYHARKTQEIASQLLTDLETRLNSHKESLEDIQATEIYLDDFLDKMETLDHFSENSLIKRTSQKVRQVFNQTVLTFLEDIPPIGDHASKVQNEREESLESYLSLTHGVLQRSADPIHRNEGRCLLERSEKIITDLTGQSLETLEGTYPQLQVIHRLREAVTTPVIAEARRGLKFHEARWAGEGYNGAQIIFDRLGAPCGIFKEKRSDDCKAYTKLTGIKKKTYPVREEVAYSFSPFAPVPFTRVIHIDQNSTESFLAGKEGSFQEFVPDSTSFGTKNSYNFDTSEWENLSTDGVQRMAVMDIRLLNTDRNSGNFLVSSNFGIIPIDHSVVLPLKAENLMFQWLKLPQTKKTMSEEIKKIIRSFDIEADRRKLLEAGIEKESVERMAISTRLLQKAVEADLPLYHIGRLMITGTKNVDTVWTTLSKRTLKVIQPAFFESVICHRILTNEEMQETVLDEVIQSYKINHELV